MIGLVTRDQPHRPAGRKIEKRRVHRPSPVSLAERRRQRQSRQPLARPQTTRRQHPPARTKRQMRLLRTAQPDPGFHRATARPNRRHVDLPRCPRQRQQSRLCVHLPAHAPLNRHAGLQRKTIPFVAAGQRHPDIARRGVGHVQRAEEQQIANLERGTFPLRRHRLGGKLQHASARQQRLPRRGAVAVQNPVIHPQPRGKLPVAMSVEPGLGQQRLHDRHARRRRAFACPICERLGGHAHPGPDTPVERNNPRLAPRTVPRIGVQVFVRRHIIDLPRRPGDGRRGREQHHKIDRSIREQSVKHQRPMQLWRKHLFDICRGLGHQRPVIDHPRRMDHRRNLAEPRDPHADGRPHLFDVADIRRGNQNLPPQRLEPLQGQYPAADRVRGIVRGQMARPLAAVGQRPPRDQGDLRTMLCDQIFGNRQPDPAKPAGNQHMRALRHYGQRLGQPRRLQPQRKAPRAAQRGHDRLRRQQFLDHCVDQRLGQSAPLGQRKV